MAHLQASPGLSDPRREAGDLPRLSAPARRALSSAGITTLSDLAGHTEAKVARLHGMGPKALGALRAALAGLGLAFIDRPPGVKSGGTPPAARAAQTTPTSAQEVRP